MGKKGFPPHFFSSLPSKPQSHYEKYTVVHNLTLTYRLNILKWEQGMIIVKETLKSSIESSKKDFRLTIDSVKQLWPVWKPMIKRETSRFYIGRDKTS